MLQPAEQISLAAKLLRLSEAEVRENSEFIKNNGALYISSGDIGAPSLIVGNDGTVLYADSSIGYARHLEEFEKGTRTPLDSF
jgi:hypothetical protein